MNIARLLIIIISSVILGYLSYKILMIFVFKDMLNILEHANPSERVSSDIEGGIAILNKIKKLEEEYGDLIPDEGAAFNELLKNRDKLSELVDILLKLTAYTEVLKDNYIKMLHDKKIVEKAEELIGVKLEHYSNMYSKLNSVLHTGFDENGNATFMVKVANREDVENLKPGENIDDVAMDLDNVKDLKDREIW